MSKAPVIAWAVSSALLAAHSGPRRSASQSIPSIPDSVESSTILLDEPDAHLHVNLQREILDYFRRKSQELGTQFLIATHAEEFARGVDASQIVSLLDRKPKRVESTPDVIRAMSDVSNEEITRVMASPYVLYVEGEDDERILRAWAGACSAQDAMDKVCFKTMGGGGKKNMKERADAHFKALRQIVPSVADRKSVV